MKILAWFLWIAIWASSLALFATCIKLATLGGIWTPLGLEWYYDPKKSDA